MITFNQGEVILTFPFTDFSTFKQRPAIIISSSIFNNSHSDVIVMAITSQIPEVIPNEDYLLSREEIEMAHLPKSSLIKTGKIVTINKILLRKKLGQLPTSTIEKLKVKLQALL